MAESNRIFLPGEQIFLPGEMLQQQQGPVEQDDDDQQVWDGTLLGEAAEGVASGLLKAGEGIVGLGAMALGGDYADKVTEGGEALRNSLGLDPEGFVGKGSEIVAQFLLGPLKAASLAGKGAMAVQSALRGTASRAALTRGERLAVAASQIGAAGLAEVAVTTDGNTTIGDWVGMGPTQTEDLIGLKGQEKNFARLRNRTRGALESTGIGLGVGAAVGALGQTSAAQSLAKTASQKLNSLGKEIDDKIFQRAVNPDEIGTFKGKLRDFAAAARYRGFLPEEVSEKRLLLDGQIETEIKKADLILKDLDQEIGVALKNMKPESQLDRVGIMNRVEEFLTEVDPAQKANLKKKIPSNLHGNVQKMRDHVDNLSEKVKGGAFLKADPVTPDGESIKDVIDAGIGSYLRRRYRVFEDAKYKPTKESIAAAKGYFRGNVPATEKELTRLVREDPFSKEILSEDYLLKNGLDITSTPEGPAVKVIGSSVTDSVANKAQEAFLSKYSIKTRGKLRGGRVAQNRLETGMFIGREQIDLPLRRLMGEIDDPKQAYMGTIADLAQFNAVDDYFSTVAELAKTRDGVGKLFVDPATVTDTQKEYLTKNNGYVTLGSSNGRSMVQSVSSGASEKADAAAELVNSQGWGSLSGYMVPEAVYKDLTNAVLAEDSFGALTTQMLFGTFLKGKAASQYSKTVLSPITQVRNFTTAVGFAVANGNIPMIGRGGSLADSAKLVYSNIANKGDDFIRAELEDAYTRGIMGTNAELREIQDMLSKGMESTARGPRNFSEAVFGEKLAAGLKTASKPLKLAESVYQGSDDFWKFFNYSAEQAKLRHALANVPEAQKISYLTGGKAPSAQQLGQDDVIEGLIKDKAAQIVRDTVPNYNKAGSDLIKFARKLPVGSFISFPAEMYRTGFNIVRQGLDDMASDIPAIQARGRQRLLGMSAVTAVAPIAAVDFGTAISGVPRDVMDAYKRSFAPSWEKGAVLIPIGQDEDGKISYINFSTSNPYDTLFRFLNEAITAGDKAMSEGQSLDAVLTDTMLGALKGVFSPFMDESIITSALLDISVRGGRTATGAEVYNPQDTLGTKGSKMFSHLLDTMMPGFVPVSVSGGEMEPSRFARGIVGSQFPDLINPKDKFERERDLTTEILRSFTGVTPLEFDPKKNLVFAAKRLNRAQGDAKRIFNRRADDANATGESLFSAFVEANEAKLRVDRSYYQVVKDLETMGLSRKEVRRILRKEQISGAKNVIRGEFEPFKISDNNKKDMKKMGTYGSFPREQYNDYRRLMKDLTLDERGSPEVPSYSSPGTVSDSSFIGESPIPIGARVLSNPSTQPSAPTISRGKSTPNLLQRAQSIAPTILGGDIGAQSANAEILRRSQQGQ